MYVMLDGFDQRKGTDRTADAIAAAIQQRCRREVSDAVVSAFGAPPWTGWDQRAGSP